MRRPGRRGRHRRPGPDRRAAGGRADGQGHRLEPRLPFYPGQPSARPPGRGLAGRPAGSVPHGHPGGLRRPHHCWSGSTTARPSACSARPSTTPRRGLRQGRPPAGPRLSRGQRAGRAGRDGATRTLLVPRRPEAVGATGLLVLRGQDRSLLSAARHDRRGARRPARPTWRPRTGRRSSRRWWARRSAAARAGGARTVAVAGGVAANSLLRRRLAEEGERPGFTWWCLRSPTAPTTPP